VPDKKILDLGKEKGTKGLSWKVRASHHEKRKISVRIVRRRGTNDGGKVYRKGKQQKELKPWKKRWKFEKSKRPYRHSPEGREKGGGQIQVLKDWFRLRTETRSLLRGRGTQKNSGERGIGKAGESDEMSHFRELQRRVP